MRQLGWHPLSDLTTRCQPQPWSINLMGLLLLLVLPAATASAQSNDYRTWTDSTGQHKVNAKLVERTEKDITLEKDDGSRVTLPLDKLSQTDREFLRSLPATTEPEVDPFLGGQPVEELERSRGIRGRDPNTPPTTLAPHDATRNRQTPSQPAVPAAEHKPRKLFLSPADKWNYQPQPATDPGPRSNAKISLTSPILQGGPAPLVETCFSANGRVLLVHTKGGANDVLSVVDLVAGKVICHEELPRGVNLKIAVSPSGARIAIASSHLGQSIHLWSLKDNQLTRDPKSIDNSEHLFFGLKHLIFLDESRLFCWSSHSCLIDLDQQRVDYEIRIDTVRSGFSVTPDAKHIGMVKNGNFHLVRMADGSVVGNLNLGADSRSTLLTDYDVAMHGQRLVAFDDGGRQLWDLQTGQRQTVHPLDSFRSRSGTAHFLTESLVFRGGELFHVDLPNPVWKFDWPTGCRILLDRDRCWLLTSEALIPVQLLDSQRLREIDEMVQLTKNFPFLKRGTRVGLDVDFRHMGGLAETAKSILLKRLQEIGVVIDPESSLQLRADARQHITSTLTIERVIDEQIVRTTAQLTPLSYDLMLVQNKRVIWRTDQPARPIGNESAPEARDRLNTPRTDFFANCELPTKPSPLFQPPPPGRSRVTLEGVVE